MTRYPRVDREHLELVVPTVPEPRQRAWGCAWMFVCVIAVLVAAAPREAHDSASSQAVRGPLGVPEFVSRPVESNPAYRRAVPSSPVPLAGTPQPTGAATYTASMTWCAPRGNQCTEWGGDARLAAVHSFTFGDRPYWVRLWRGDNHADALVVSHCACHDSDGYIDVSPAVFRQLAPLSRGRVGVSVEVLDWPYEPGGDPPSHPDDDAMRAEDAATLPPTSVAR